MACSVKSLLLYIYCNLWLCYCFLMDSDDLNELYDEPGLDSDGNSLVDSSDSSDEHDTQARPPVKFLPTSK